MAGFLLLREAHISARCGFYRGDSTFHALMIPLMGYDGRIACVRGRSGKMPRSTLMMLISIIEAIADF